MLRKTLTILAGTVALTLGGIPPAAAGGYYGHHGFGYGYGYRRHYGHGYGYRSHGSVYLQGDGDAAAIGLAIGLPLAALLYYNAKRYDYDRARYEQPYDRYERYPAQAPVQPAPAPYSAQVPAAPRPGCQQEREYTTTIIIGGEEVQAYGTACLQADGTWKQLGLNR